MDTRQTVVAFLKAHQARDEKAIAELCADDIRVRGGPTELVGVRAYLDSERNTWQLLPNQSVIAESILHAGDDIVVQWLDSNQSSASTPSITAGCTIFKVVSDKIAEAYIYIDRSTIPAGSHN
ncbi:MAG: SnoaL-like domain [Massilia sp.]|jgi:predicted ester cyclase|nr:SnoaL-like domain [Massilia sp.]